MRDLETQRQEAQVSVADGLSPQNTSTPEPVPVAAPVQPASSQVGPRSETQNPTPAPVSSPAGTALSVQDAENLYRAVPVRAFKGMTQDQRVEMAGRLGIKNAGKMSEGALYEKFAYNPLSKRAAAYAETVAGPTIPASTSPEVARRAGPGNSDRAISGTPA
ncbi:hypothetical protein CCP1ISM_3160002 [Azospirillaceae bacterium]